MLVKPLSQKYNVLNSFSLVVVTIQGTTDRFLWEELTSFLGLISPVVSWKITTKNWLPLRSYKTNISSTIPPLQYQKYFNTNPVIWDELYNIIYWNYLINKDCWLLTSIYNSRWTADCAGRPSCCENNFADESN